MLSSVPAIGPRKLHPKAKFSWQEDESLTVLVQTYGADNWQEIAKNMPERNMRQCRDRWLNYLSPEINNSPWTAKEDQLLISKVQELGAVWKFIATFFNARTDINVKNRWHLIQRRIRKEFHFMFPFVLTAHDKSTRPEELDPVEMPRAEAPTEAILDHETRNNLWDDYPWDEQAGWEF
jgi:hypothetical protein